MAISRGVTRNVFGKMVSTITGRAGLSTDPVIHYNRTSIVGSPITQLTNLGTGGPSFDQFPVGTAANLTVVQNNGLDCVRYGGSVSTKNNAGSLISGKGTTFLVAIFTNLAINFRVVEQNGGANHVLDVSAADVRIQAGGAVLTAFNLDTNIMLVTAKWNKDATSEISYKGMVSRTEIGDIGSAEFQGISMGGRANGSEQGEWTMCEYAHFDVEFTPAELTLVETFLINEHAITVV